MTAQKHGRRHLVIVEQMPMISYRATLLAILFVLTLASLVFGQQRPNPATAMAAQREAMAAIAFMDGTWRGTAWTLLPTGGKHEITQTERVGSFLDGKVKVIEGRGYEADGGDPGRDLARDR
jgi:hypothetical protein